MNYKDILFNKNYLLGIVWFIVVWLVASRVSSFLGDNLPDEYMGTMVEIGESIFILGVVISFMINKYKKKFALGFFSALVLFFVSIFIIPNIFSDKIMDGANPDYYKEGIVVAIAADKIKIKSDNKEYDFDLHSTNLNFLVKVKKDTQKSFGNLSDIKVGDRVEVEGREMKDEVVVSFIYLIK